MKKSDKMDSVSIRFYLNQMSKKGDKVKIYGRLTVNRQKAEFATNHYIYPKNWDEAKQGPKNILLIKQDLADIENKIFSIRRDLMDRDINPTARNIVNVLKNRGNSYKSTDLITYYEKQFQEMKDKGESAVSTIRHYSGTLKILKMFYEYSQKRAIEISNIDYKFIKDLDYYMSAVYISPYDQKLKRNTINKHHARVRSIINMAVREELIDRNPYSSYKFKFTKSEREYLTEDELLAIQELDLSNNRSLDKIRDIFLFTCNTGVRFQDAQDLTLSHLKTTDNGKMYLNFKMTKTSEMVAIPLSKQAKSIITKYSDSPLRITVGSLLPRISNAKFNEYIKIITKAVGIEKKVSHHVARHTFATLALNRGVSIVAVQKLLGHTTVRTTEIYAKMLQSTVFDEMDKFEKD